MPARNPPNKVEPKKASKPVIIDYPKDRAKLKEEFAKIAARPGFSESVEMAKEVIQGGKRKRTVRKPNRQVIVSPEAVIVRPASDDPSGMYAEPILMEDNQPKPHGGPDPFGGDDNIDVDDQIEESMPDCQTETP